MNDHRPCERQCKGPCGLWKHHSRFRGRERKTPHGTVWEFDKDCKDCQQIKRNDQKNADRPLAIIRGRAQEAAHRAGTTTEFFWTQMNYRALVPWMRAMMTDEGLCIACGHAFVNERDIQIDHLFPPRHRQDWGRLHTRNVRLGCGSCNNSKGSKEPDQWLDEQEVARITNLLYREEEPEVRDDDDPQLSLGF